ncbi:DUF1772 domain-containing protein [Pedobacter sp. KR3-3]|uniref:DUF1772 domain-containing protein n=1 Tax=Pedobacter albus TaxID=3113905 RepID=A0ABU7I3P8_9SPHI|nr:DUF1772 domain-containing protein [Pedobacter sp. KR3-3]MEE1944048.1 DUF1772 domain-containing protein [Pedobacter sp. KR3-3]
MKRTSMSIFILAITTIACGLIAGLFYSYSCSVNPGLKTLTDFGYLSAMQAINRAILNPVFFCSFMGALVLLPLSTYFSYTPAPSTRFWLLLSASILYIVAVFGVTAFGNVPLNDALDKFDLSTATPEALAKQRALFETSWNALHAIRTWASAGSFVLTVLACIFNQSK